jgi:hypothetical protein
MLMNRFQVSGVRCQDERGQKIEDRGQKSEVGRRKVEKERDGETGRLGEGEVSKEELGSRNVEREKKRIANNE